MTQEGESSLWWLSYADEAGSRGVVVVEASSFLHACARSRELDLSPGGQVLGYPVPPGEWHERCQALEGRLWTPAELEEKGFA